jgi:hypothetical protein
MIIENLFHPITCQPKSFIVKRWINVSTFEMYYCSHFDDFSLQNGDVLKTTCPQVTLRRTVYTSKRQSSENTFGLYLYVTARTVHEDQSKYRFTDSVIHIPFLTFMGPCVVRIF